MEKEFEVTFHVTADTAEEAEQWRKKALAALDANQELFWAESETGTGGYCSGHVGEQVK